MLIPSYHDIVRFDVSMNNPELAESINTSKHIPSNGKHLQKLRNSKKIFGEESYIMDRETSLRPEKFKLQLRQVSSALLKQYGILIETHTVAADDIRMRLYIQHLQEAKLVFNIAYFVRVLWVLVNEQAPSLNRRL